MAADQKMASSGKNGLERVFEAWQAALRIQPANWAAMLDAAATFRNGAKAHESLGGNVGATQTTDRRFDSPVWGDQLLFDEIRKTYLSSSQSLLQTIEAAPLDIRTRRQMRFLARQLVDAMSPTNFVATNPDVLKLAIETGGGSLARGARNLLEDAQHGRITLSANSFRVGVDLANTPGDVVFENELIQLIQYRPATSRVRVVPLLIVPSVVNKYYILDLAPETSLVRYLVNEGFTVFMVSWRNISAAQGHLGWDDYLNLGALAAIETVCEITHQPVIQAAGYCTGGALLASALAVLAARGERPVRSMTLLMTMIEFSDPGDLGIYLDPVLMAQFHTRFATAGVVPGRELTMAFSSLRANDLVWSFVVGNYLKGRTPPAFDLLYWNTDDANIAGPMFSTYVQDCYVDNKLVVPDALNMCGEQVDLRRIDLPTYVFAASDDHLVPWTSAYGGVQHLAGDIEFVLGAGGHVTAPLNSPPRGKRNYWAGGSVDGDAAAWRASAQASEGSWWPHWSHWLHQHAGISMPAPKRTGSRAHRPIEPAPGRFVLERMP